MHSTVDAHVVFHPKESVHVSLSVIGVKFLDRAIGLSDFFHALFDIRYVSWHPRTKKRATFDLHRLPEVSPPSSAALCLTPSTAGAQSISDS